MNIRKFITYIVFVSLNLLAYNTYAQSSVWKVSKGANYFYLGGTIHLLTKGDYPLPQEFITAYNDASEIIFETALMATQTPEFQMKFITAMTYSDDRTLAGELQPQVYRNLQEFMEARQIPLVNFKKFQPWGMSLMITILEYQRLGMMPDYGLDVFFNNLALADNKEVVGLETPAAQLNFLKSMAKMNPNLAIEYTLRDLEQLPQFIQIMKQAWRSGDLESFSSHELVVQMKKDFPEMYDILITHRNNSWMTQLSSLNDDKNKEFVLVGAMHLNGKEGLLFQLQARGFKAKQL
ncbi:MAG: TraB/GumN family protein [Oceanospirillaceae bacterium]